MLFMIIIVIENKADLEVMQMGVFSNYKIINIIITLTEEEGVIFRTTQLDTLLYPFYKQHLFKNRWLVKIIIMISLQNK